MERNLVPPTIEATGMPRKKCEKRRLQRAPKTTKGNGVLF
jgi:hypothetical protein